MAALKQKLKEILARRFKKGQPDLWEVNGSNRIAGILMWEGFDDMEQVDRQRKLWKILEDELSAEEQLQVSAILTMTPDEARDDDEDSSND